MQTEMITLTLVAFLFAGILGWAWADVAKAEGMHEDFPTLIAWAWKGE